MNRSIAILLTMVMLAASAGAADFGIPVSEKRATLESLIATAGPVVIGAGLVAWDESTAGSGDGLAALGVGTGILGLWFGPSFGHFYAEQPGRAGTGILIRTVGLSTVVLGAVASLAGGSGITHADFANSPATVIEPENDGNIGQALMIIGGSVVVGSAFYDIMTASSSARRTNASGDFGTRIDIAPTYLAQHETMGLGVRVMF